MFQLTLCILSLLYQINQIHSRSFNLALWHEGIVGNAQTDYSIFEQYASDMIQWAVTNKIDQIFLNVLNPDVMPCCNASNIVNAFLNKVPSTMKVGAVTYVRPKDSDWNIDNSLPGGNSCILIPPNNANNSCPENVSTSPLGCPNDMTQAVYFLGEMNKIATNKFNTIAFDGEDLGEYADPWGMCAALQAAKIYAPDIVDAGFAKGPSITPKSINGTVAYPEMYWVGELAATGCHGQQTTPECTNTTYVKYKNQPQAFLDFWSSDLDKYKDSVNQDGVWVLFSIENLSYGLLNKGPSCIASKYFGGNGYKQSICGTFDGFSYWDYQYFEQFLELYAQKYGVKNIGIYEAQFIPSTWF
eukprot:432363_1